MWTPALQLDSRAPLFRQIVEVLADDIAQNRLPVGARLPPHRDLADELGLARGTIARAYQEAEALGLVRSEVGRGTYVLAPGGGSRPYSTLFEHPTVLRDLGSNVPLSDVDPDPADVLRRLADRPDRRSMLRYLPPEGVRRHRAAGVRWLELSGIDAAVDDVLLCAGAQHALFVAFAHLAARARTLYVEELTYPGLHGVGEVLRLPLVPVAMDGEGMIPGSLERLWRRHGDGIVYCMPTIHNPTGAVMSEKRRRAIAEVARAKGLFIVEDAANRMLVDRPAPPIAWYAPERTLLVASVSKILAPGLRVAFLVAPQRERSALTRHIWATQWMVGTIGAELVAMWLEDGTVERTLKRKRREARRRQGLARRILGRHRVRAHPHALYAWVALEAPWDAESLTAEAARQNIVVTPSSAFWARQTPPPPAVRISLGGVDDLGQLEIGLASLRQVITGARAKGKPRGSTPQCR